MFCGKCGNSINDGQMFCDKCGHKAGEPVSAPYMLRGEKSEGLAAVLSFFWGGAGQIYVGRIWRGLGIIATYVTLAIIGMALIFSSRTFKQIRSDYFYETYAYVFEGPLLTLGLLFLAACFIFSIWNVFDAYNLAKQYNASLRATGNPPW